MNELTCAEIDCKEAGCGCGERFKRAKAVAKRYFTETNKDYGCAVVNKQGLVAGWMDMLRSPNHWEPGCIAVMDDGTCYVARGGDAYHGADLWDRVSA